MPKYGTVSQVLLQLVEGKQFTVNPSPTVSPQRAYLFEAHLHVLFPDYFKLSSYRNG